MDIKTRIALINGMYIGEVYTTWHNVITDAKWNGWRRVTRKCMTKIGAQSELNKWLRENNIQ